MKKLYSFLIALCAATVLLPAVAANSVEQQGDAADNIPAAKNAVTPHNHMRDGKGMSIPTKPAPSTRATQPTAVESETAEPVLEKKSTTKRKLRPHSHPQDGKGMYVPEKK